MAGGIITVVPSCVCYAMVRGCGVGHDACILSFVRRRVSNACFIVLLPSVHGFYYMGVVAENGAVRMVGSGVGILVAYFSRRT